MVASNPFLALFLRQIHHYYNREILQQLVQLAVNILKEKLMKCVFNVALTDSHLQRMVYQEIQDTDSQIRGRSLKILLQLPALPF
jgi:hypothetical protein